MNSRSSSIREMIVDRCLRSKSRHTLQDIKKAVNAELEARNEPLVSSNHTILDDIYGIANRWHINLNIEKIGRYTYYSYEDPDFTIYKTPLTEDEVINLATTLAMIKRFKGIPNFEWVQDFIDKSQNVMTGKVVNEEVISLEENPYVRGLSYLIPLYDAIIHKQVIDIKYRPFSSSDIQDHTLHPYFLKQYNNRWFLFGCNDGYRTLSNFALDRIEGISINGRIMYLDNDVCDFGEYFDDMVGVTKHKDAILDKVQLWICKDQWPYIETKPLHSSQKVLERREDGSVVVELEVCQNWELDQLILLHAERIQVLEPASLRERIGNRLRAAAALYGYK